nr:DUF5592 family protein [Enterococcus cecorum]
MRFFFKEGDQVFKIPTNIKAEPKIFLGMLMLDIMIIISTVLLCHSITKDLELVFPMRIAMIILSFLFGVFLTIKPSSNPDKRMIQVLMIYAKQDKGLYHSLDPLAVKEYQESKSEYQRKEKEW